jgi:hypothetical protein
MRLRLVGCRRARLCSATDPCLLRLTLHWAAIEHADAVLQVIVTAYLWQLLVRRYKLYPHQLKKN